MKLSLEKQHENRIEFVAEDMANSFANMLRRYSMSRVPVLALDRVTIYDNNGPVWDEYLCHRLGLMPITTPAKLAPDVEINFTLDAEGPKPVYSSELKSTDDAVHVAKDKIIIVTLGQNQHLRLEAKAVLGIGRKHAKFQAGLVSYGQGMEEGEYTFMVESFYQMPPKEVLLRGVGIIERDIDEIAEAIGGKAAKKSKKKKEKE